MAALGVAEKRKGFNFTMIGQSRVATEVALSGRDLAEQAADQVAGVRPVIHQRATAGTLDVGVPAREKRRTRAVADLGTDALDPADRAAFGQGNQVGDGRIEAVVQAGRESEPQLIRAQGERSGGIGVNGERLLNEDVLACLKRRGRLEGMVGVGRRHDHGVDVIALECRLQIRLDVRAQLRSQSPRGNAVAIHDGHQSRPGNRDRRRGALSAQKARADDQNSEVSSLNVHDIAPCSFFVVS